MIKKIWSAAVLFLLNKASKTIKLKLIISIIFLVFIHAACFSQNSKRWGMDKNGGISWNVKADTGHTDHIEMSGLQVSAIITYGISANGELILSRKLVYPMLRTIPNNTHASLIEEYKDHNLLKILVNDKVVTEKPESFSIKGNLVISSKTNTQVEIKRTIFPSVNKPALVEIIELKNTGANACSVNITNGFPVIKTDTSKGVYGEYVVAAQATDSGTHTIPAGDTYTFSVAYAGRKLCEEKYSYSADYEWKKRQQFINEIFSNLVLETPNDTINREFAFAKLRTTESIYDTKAV